MARNKGFTPKYLILDVDGVLTDGQFHYTSAGKVMKIFGPDDADAISILKSKMEIFLVSGDKRGFDISQKRAMDMKLPIYQVSTFDRTRWIKENYDLKKTIYMGDGIFDSLVFKEVAYGIAPANAFPLTKRTANFVTKRSGAEGAVAEAIVHIYNKFFERFSIKTLEKVDEAGAWNKKSR